MVTLYGPNGQPIETPRRPPQTPPPVVPRYGRWSSHPSRGLTPARLASLLLRGEEGDWTAWAELAEDIEEKDGHIASVLQTRRQSVMGRKLEVTAATSEPGDEEIADWVRGVLEAGEVLQTVGPDLMDAVGKGIALMRIDWELNEHRKAVPTRFEWCHQKFLATDPTTYDLLLQTDRSPRGEPFEPWRWIIHRYRGRSGWQARSGLLRTLAWLYLFKNFALKDWVVFAEVFGMPLRLGRYKSHSTPEDRNALKAALQQLGSDAAGIIPDGTDIEFITGGDSGGGKSSAEVYERLAAFCDRAASKVVLGQTLTTDTSGGTGTFAAANVHDRVRDDLTQSDAEALARTLRDQLVRPLVGFNYGWDRRMPSLDLVPDEAEDYLQVAELFDKAGKAGVRIGRTYAHARLGIPEPAEGEAVLEPGGSAAPAPPPTSAIPPVSGAEALRMALSQGRIDDLVLAAHGEAAKTPGERAFGGLTKAAAGVSPQAAQRALLEALARGGDADELADLIARQTFVAHLEGEADG